ncbi:MAG: hypothetical protein NTV22_06200 [bacterium]|nr:hypothetical protein [bacterium]
MRAGWNDFNVVAADSIYQSLSSSLRRMQLIREYPRVTSTRLALCAERVTSMPPANVEKMFTVYCNYVRACQAQQSTSWAPWVRTPLLTQLYDPATLALTTEYQKRALILQEYVRIIAGHPTWLSEEYSNASHN